jgi:hypothetical protein
MDPEPDLDLLIRSASSLLSVIGQQTKFHQRILEFTHKTRPIRSLDRIAILLATKAKEETVAVASVLKPDECILINSISPQEDAKSGLE